MFERENRAHSRLWAGTPICMAVVLLFVAFGAAATVWGISSPENTWIWVGISWGAAGLAGGRYALRGERNTFLRAVIYVAAAMLTACLLGLTATEVPVSRHWLWYVGAGLLGAVLGCSLPYRSRKRKTRPKGKTGYVAGRQR